MQPGIVGFVEGAHPLAVGAGKAIEVVATIHPGVPLQRSGIVRVGWPFQRLRSLGDALTGTVVGAEHAGLAELLHPEVDAWAGEQGHVGNDLGQADPGSVLGRHQQAHATQLPQAGVDGDGNRKGHTISGRNGPVAQTPNEVGELGGGNGHPGVPIPHRSRSQAPRRVGDAVIVLFEGQSDDAVHASGDVPGVFTLLEAVPAVVDGDGALPVFPSRCEVVRVEPEGVELGHTGKGGSVEEGGVPNRQRGLLPVHIQIGRIPGAHSVQSGTSHLSADPIPIVVGTPTHTGVTPGRSHEGVVQTGLIRDLPLTFHEVDMGNALGDFRPILPSRVPDVSAEHGVLLTHGPELVGIELVGICATRELFHGHGAILGLRFHHHPPLRGPQDPRGAEKGCEPRGPSDHTGAGRSSRISARSQNLQEFPATDSDVRHGWLLPPGRLRPHRSSERRSVPGGPPIPRPGTPSPSP